jgi:hypothetical protein
MGYKILPPIDSEKYGPRKGLEGPFRFRGTGAVYYYDPREGKAYNPQTDMYYSHEEFEEQDRERGNQV